MKSRTSFFNAGLFRSITKRTWPLWFAYLFVCFLSLPLPTLIESGEYYRTVPDYLTSGSWATLSVIGGFVMAIITACAVFSFMYNARGTGLIASMPIKREAVFGTAYLAGLLPVVLTDLICVVLNLLFSLGYIGQSEIKITLSQLLSCNAAIFGSMVMTYILFYGIAVLIATFTGSLVSLPVLYAIANFLFVGMEWVVRCIVASLVYGLTESGMKLKLTFLSPFVKLVGMKPDIGKWLFGVAGEDYGFIQEGVGVGAYFGILLAYAAVGLVLTVIALLLYRGRRMEAVGDFVAIPALRPVFRYGISICASLCFGLLFYSLFESVMVAELAVLILGLVIGALLGYAVAQMLISRSVHLREWRVRDMVILLSLCFAFSLGCCFDVFGLAARLPDATGVEYVDIGYGMCVYDKDDVQKLIDLNRTIVDEHRRTGSDDLDDHEYDADHAWIELNYFLKGGDRLTRAYPVRIESESYRMYSEIVSTPSVLLQRFSSSVSVEAKNVMSADLWLQYYEPDGTDKVFDLTPEQAEELYSAFVKDVLEGGVTLRLLDLPYGATVSIELFGPDRETGESTGSYLTLPITTDCRRSAEWIEENLGIDLVEYENSYLRSLQNFEIMYG